MDTRLGVVRESMYANPLIFRPSLGQSSRSRLLPPWLGPDFVYGTRTPVGDGVAEELNQYKAQWANQSHHHTQRTKQAPGVPDITFGITTRPLSPMADVLAHQYGRHWIEEQQRYNSAQHPDKVGETATQHYPQTPRQGRRDSDTTLPPNTQTRTSLLRRSRAMPKPEPQCTIRRFTKVGPSLDTFRDPESRLKAFMAHRSDCVSRKGALGQGTYNLD
ncbi:hypothetical protein NHX12_029081 [Muraenolepis orangiensis]|uniref:Uncharacterized protein n=1 Tax=Muraenolepis orangiensis TaxID=630683 RepID=A0A9Q0EFC1_9TELE|nr:hypothetical protein NHX12_029081 [Muraenolepis orangiensis]